MAPFTGSRMRQNAGCLLEACCQSAVSSARRWSGLVGRLDLDLGLLTQGLIHKPLQAVPPTSRHGSQINYLLYLATMYTYGTTEPEGAGCLSTGLPAPRHKGDDGDNVPLVPGSTIP